MSEREKTAVETLCETMDAKYSRLMNVVYGLVVVILGAGAIQFVTFGEVKSQAKITAERTDLIWRDYMPTIFMEGIMKTYSLQTQSIVAKFGGDAEVVRRENEKFDDLRSELLNNLQQLRGGMTSTTRSIKPSSTTHGTSE